MKKGKARLWLVAALSAALCVQAPLVRAEIVTTDQVGAASTVDQDRAKVQGFLDRTNVQDRLRAMGVDGLLVKDRVAALSDQEVHALAQRIDSLPAGGDLHMNNYEIIIILLIVILVAILV